MRKRLLAAAITAAACAAGCAAATPPRVALVDRQLAPCPGRPNCVTTQDRDHAVEPLRYEGTRDQARQRLVEVLGSMPGGRVVAVAPHYVRAEFTSSLFGFVDDVEAYLDPADAVIHLRSASRVGYYDFGANRGRIAEIRERFANAVEPAAGKEGSG